MKNNILALSVVALVGCGGGGSDSSAPAPTPTPPPAPAAPNLFEGLMLETGSTRMQKLHLVASNEIVMGITGNQSADGSMTSADGVLLASSKATNGSYSGDIFYFTQTSKCTGNMVGTYQAASTFAGTLTACGQSQSLTSAAPAASSYSFNKAAALSEIAGDWKMNGWSISIDSAGLLSGADNPISQLAKCRVGGAIVPTAGAKNVYVTTMAVTCSGVAGPTLIGLGASYLLPNGKRQILIGAVDRGATSSRAFAGVR